MFFAGDLSVFHLPEGGTTTTDLRLSTNPINLPFTSSPNIPNDSDPPGTTSLNDKIDRPPRCPRNTTRGEVTNVINSPSETEIVLMISLALRYTTGI